MVSVVRGRAPWGRVNWLLMLCWKACTVLKSRGRGGSKLKDVHLMGAGDASAADAVRAAAAASSSSSSSSRHSNR
jgi:hypothetical protein